MPQGVFGPLSSVINRSVTAITTKEKQHERTVSTRLLPEEVEESAFPGELPALRFSSLGRDPK